MKCDFHNESGKEHGASFVFFSIAKDTRLDKLTYSRTSEQWIKDVLAMIAGRVVYGGSKLALNRVNSTSTLWEQAGIHEDNIDVDDHCYEPNGYAFHTTEHYTEKSYCKNQRLDFYLSHY